MRDFNYFWKFTTEIYSITKFWFRFYIQFIYFPTFTTFNNFSVQYIHARTPLSINRQEIPFPVSFGPLQKKN